MQKKHQAYKETSLFYIRNEKREQIGAVAIGLTDKNRIKITASARSIMDKNVPGRHKAIAFNRLQNAFVKRGGFLNLVPRPGQTRYLEGSPEDVKNLSFE